MVTDLKQTIDSAIDKAMKGGIAGSSAMVIQVSSLMWLRTTMNYQYANGGTFRATLKFLYKEGGVLRFYGAFPFAILQGPLTRFGDTAANMGILELTKNSGLSLPVKTGIASITSGCVRILVMPIDAYKTTIQVNGKDGFNILSNRIKQNGVRTLWNGSLAAMSATIVGHYPWFLTYNYLNSLIKKDAQDTTFKKLSKQAGIGFTASVISDTCSNSLRIVKTKRQTYQTNIKYKEVIKEIIKKEGIPGILFRGLDTRILANGLNGMLFSVMWKVFMDK